MAKLSLILILCASLVFSYTNANLLDTHRRHGMVRKRAPQLGGILAEASPAESSAAAQSTDAPPANNSPTPTPSSSAQLANSASAASPTTSGGLLGGLTSGILQPVTSSSASTSSPASSAPHTSAPAQTTQAAAASTPSSGQQQQQEGQSTSVFFVTASSASTPTQSSAPESASSLSHTAIIVLIIIAVSVGASAILWTIIRKWKFSPSSNFEDRMQPIDWQPGSGDAGELPGSHRPTSNASSFQSNAQSFSDDHSNRARAAALGPLPDHDFTPGPAHFAPVGGYADLTRGVTPGAEPAMHEALTRAPSINHQYQYDQYGVPLHHGYSGPNY